jgi:hypothetical protein
VEIFDARNLWYKTWHTTCEPWPKHWILSSLWRMICKVAFGYNLSILYYKRVKELKIVSHPDIFYPHKLLSLKSTLKLDPMHLKFPPWSKNRPGQKTCKCLCMFLSCLYPIRFFSPSSTPTGRRTHATRLHLSTEIFLSTPTTVSASFIRRLDSIVVLKIQIQKIAIQCSSCVRRMNLQGVFQTESAI